MMLDESTPHDSNSLIMSLATVLSEYLLSTYAFELAIILTLAMHTAPSIAMYSKRLTRNSLSTYNHFASNETKSRCFAHASLCKMT